MKKYIHYCWFGDKPLPKLAKKCLNSWKKYLPDFEIIKWDESNVDLNECYFIKEAYKNKKWAFVSDYVRAKALFEFGGIYFDTDMEVVKNIEELLKNSSFLGLEDSGYVAVGVWYEKNKGSLLVEKLLEEYQSIKDINFENINEYSNYSIPKLISHILEPMGLTYSSNEIQKLENDIIIYPREYFYPYSYNRRNNFFTDNTYMVHYYDASWIPKRDLLELKFIRMVGSKNTLRILSALRFGKRNTIRLIKIFSYPITKYRKKLENKKNDLKLIEKIVKRLDQLNSNKIIIHNPNWLGTTNASKELFENTLALPEIFSKKIVDDIAQILVNKKINFIVFSAFSYGWYDLAQEIKKLNKKITIKVIWHGSNSMNIEDYDWTMFKQIFDLLDKKIIKSIGFVKKSMYELYKSKGYNCEFIMNTVNLKYLLNKENRRDKKIRIGIYASGDRWVKNFYNQLAGASLVDNVLVDCIPANYKTFEFARILKLKITGSEKPVSREELIERLAKNDINLYVTFTECAPLLPLESFEVGVPCITGNNHHYWEKTKLREMLVVDENDNPNEIYDKIQYCLENKNEIIKLYNNWKKEYDKESKKSVNKFMEE